MEESRSPIYLDYNATTPLDPSVIEAMQPFLNQHFGNPSSSHPYGRAARSALEKARAQVSALLNCAPAEVIFTSGGTEANNYAIRGAALAHRKKGNHIVTSKIEHPAVMNVCKQLEREGFEVSYLPVDEHGVVDSVSLQQAIRPETVLITVMHANNEVGTIQPIEEIARLARSRGIIFHTDAAQSVGKISSDVKQLSVDLLSLAGHKLYAPKGVGALYVRQGLAIEPLMYGAGQECGRRPGTENVLEIVGLGTACHVGLQGLNAHSERMRRTRDRLESGLRDRIPRLRVNGGERERLPNTLSMSIQDIDAEALLREIGDQVAASAGSACHSGQLHVSPVLTAMNVPPAWARGTLRLSTGRTTADEEVDLAIAIITVAVQRLRAVGNSATNIM